MTILVARKARAKAQRSESARHSQRTAKRPPMRTRRWLVPRVGGAGHRGQLDLDHWGNPAGIPVLAQPSYTTLGKSLTLSESQISSPKQ